MTLHLGSIPRRSIVFQWSTRQQLHLLHIFYQNTLRKHIVMMVTNFLTLFKLNILESRTLQNQQFGIQLSNATLQCKLPINNLSAHITG
jgi:hypothetical protein